MENEEKQKLKAQINSEKKLTEEAVKKLYQIVQEKKPKNGNVKNGNETKRLEKDLKRLQLELNKERESYAKMHKQLNQEIQTLKEELDKREQEIFKFKSSLNNTSIFGNTTSGHHHNHHHHNSTGSTHSNNNNHHHHHHFGTSLIQSGIQAVNNVVANATFSLQNIHGSPSAHNTSAHNFTLMNNTSMNLDESTIMMADNLGSSSSNGLPDDRLESWLSIPNKRNIKKHGWKKLYVVLRKGKLFFYQSLKDYQSQDPYMTIELDKVYHVRAVTHTDVVRAGTKDISKIFQILYDVNAVNGPSSNGNSNNNNVTAYLYSGSVGSTTLTSTDSVLSKKSANMLQLDSNSSPSSSNIINSNSNNSLSTSILMPHDINCTAGNNSTDSVIGNATFRSLNGGNDENQHSMRFNSDAISVGSNDSVDVRALLYLI